MNNKSLSLVLMTEEVTTSLRSSFQAKLPRTVFGSFPRSPAGQGRRHPGKSGRSGPSYEEGRQIALPHLLRVTLEYSGWGTVLIRIGLAKRTSALAPFT